MAMRRHEACKCGKQNGVNEFARCDVTANNKKKTNLKTYSENNKHAYFLKCNIC